MPKEFIPHTIEYKEPILEPLLGVNDELRAKGIYSRLKIVSQVVTGTGSFYIKSGFPPKLVQVNHQDADRFCHGETDFLSTFSYMGYNNGGTFATSQSTDLVNTGSLTGNATTRYFDGFNFTVSSFSGGSKTLYFTCFS